MHLQRNPPEAISETYFECFPTVSSTLLNALGVASGNTSLAMTLFFFAVLPVLYLILAVLSQIPPKEEYSVEEKEQATELLSIILLRIRDGKSRGIQKSGVLTKLAHELMAAAQIHEAEAADSDDEDLGADDGVVEVEGRGLELREGGSPVSPASPLPTSRLMREQSYKIVKGGRGGRGGGLRRENTIHKRKLEIFTRQ